MRYIYNVDDVRLFFNDSQQNRLSCRCKAALDVKYSKTRLTGLAAGNAAGEKRPMFINGKGVKNRSNQFEFQKKVWKHSAMFEQYVRNFVILMTCL